MNSNVEWCCSIPVIGPIINNPIFTALLLTILVLIVIMVVYKVQEQGGSKLFKCAFYIFILVTAITFLHHYAIMKIAKNNFAKNEVKNIFSGIKQSKENSYDAIPIINNDKYYDGGGPSSKHGSDSKHGNKQHGNKQHGKHGKHGSKNYNDEISDCTSNTSNTSNTSDCTSNTSDCTSISSENNILKTIIDIKSPILM